MAKENRNLLIIVRYRSQPRVTFRELGLMFGISPQAAWEIVRRYEKRQGHRRMTSRDRDMLVIAAYRHHPCLSFDEIGKMFNLTGARVHQIIRNHEAKHGKLKRKGQVNV